MKKSQTKSDDKGKEFFRNPPSEYRGAPFWAWNTRLRRSQLLRQIEIFREMGFGGFHIHSRTGLNTAYLGQEYLARVRDCVEAAGRHNMHAWLYDEDRWPSGFGGGSVTRNKDHRLKYFLFTRTPYCGLKRPALNISNALVGREENGELLARYAISLSNGFLTRYRRLSRSEAATGEEREWFLYRETASPVPWYNNCGYADLLSEKTTRRFLKTTHVKLKATVGEYFGNVIPAIFTDEPQHAIRGCLPHPDSELDVTMPATAGLLASYAAAFGEDLLDAFPELVWERSGSAPSKTRYRYHNHVTDLFAASYAGVLAKWCSANGLALTGHMMEEPTLESQTRSIGEAMRSLAHFHIPGVDMLCDRMELTTVKQAQSVCRQFGRSGVASELYGVTGWGFTFAGHKAQGDWQAALGVSFRVPHLSWLSMEGEAKRDYPASIHYQSPWWKEYRLIEDHFARVNVMMRRGTPVARIGVIHPMESYWLCYGPFSQTRDEREQRDRRFQELPEWLLGELLDFDYISESLLPSIGQGGKNGRLVVGKISYDIVIVPDLKTIRSTTLKQLSEFTQAGGTVVFLGSAPSLEDGGLSELPGQLVQKAARCPWEKQPLLALLEPFREIDCISRDGSRCHTLLYQMRQDGPNRHLFICNHDRGNAIGNLQLLLRGEWRPVLNDTFTGSETELPALCENGRTILPVEIPACGHMLLTLIPGRARKASCAKESPRHETQLQLRHLPWVVPCEKERAWHETFQFADPVPVELSEPNVLLLDYAEWSFGADKWQAPDEVLRITNKIRESLGLPGYDGNDTQPWARQTAPLKYGTVRLRFEINCDHVVRGSHLAIEEPSTWTLELDGHRMPARACGWWVDESIKRIQLPVLTKGRHNLVLSRVFTDKITLERCYILGDFGVRTAGRHSKLTAPVRKLAFGDWTTQGLPFYAGNVIYCCRTPQLSKAMHVGIRFPRFSAALLKVETGLEKKPAAVAFPPYLHEFDIENHVPDVIKITAFGDRHNAFGPIHNIDRNLLWIGPEAWRSTGDHWAYEYQLKPMGLLTAPRLHAVRAAKESLPD